ncbi:MAG TPA: hypothetical protein VKS24_09190 [Bradyrhizobium sp.]|nr:hypothetical protein [Bradyrhizobium sp.]
MTGSLCAGKAYHHRKIVATRWPDRLKAGPAGRRSENSSRGKYAPSLLFSEDIPLDVAQSQKSTLFEPCSILLTSRGDLKKLLRGESLYFSATFLFRKSENHLVQDSPKATDLLGIKDVELDFTHDTLPFRIPAAHGCVVKADILWLKSI